LRWLSMLVSGPGFAAADAGAGELSAFCLDTDSDEADGSLVVTCTSATRGERNTVLSEFRQ
jgi:hypothetical protein